MSYYYLPISFSEDLFCRHVKTKACLGKGININQWAETFFLYIFLHDTPFPNKPWYSRVCSKSFENYVEKEIASYENVSFSNSVLKDMY